MFSLDQYTHQNSFPVDGLAWKTPLDLNGVAIRQGDVIYKPVITDGNLTLEARWVLEVLDGAVRCAPIRAGGGRKSVVRRTDACVVDLARREGFAAAEPVAL